MGCDIHVTVERQVAGSWVMIHQLTRELGRDRNYARFAALAGVRGPGPDPRGLPDDVSAGTKYWVDSWGSDGHSHSWELMDSFLRTLRQTEHRDTDARGKTTTSLPEDYTYLGTFLDDDADYRVVFWFDN